MTWARDHARRCQGTGPDGDERDCREEVGRDPLARRWLGRWCWSRAETTERLHGQAKEE